ncbi:hypothetical protein B6D60_04425 [candidate division KSB1 bacterium 4484_87]|nr:MAG: hypothetical protein B6D60_04425 [candidate division KSB1 bacterium 4484_87]
MENRSALKVFDWVLRMVVAGIFIYAGVIKILNPASFADQVDNYRILPYFLVAITAVVLPWLEVICGILLLTGRWRAASSLILLGLSFIFVLAVASAMIRGLDINCGCFSVEGEGEKIGASKVIEDVLLFAANFVLFRRSLK